MSAIYATLIFFAICALYGYARLKKSEDCIYSVSAGSADEHNADNRQCDIVKSESHVVQLPDGTYASTSRYYRIRINGTCMERQEIKNGEEWLVRKIKKGKSLRKQVKVGDVLFIYLQDTDRYKIRRVKSFIDDVTVETYSYDKNGNEQMSSKPHSQATILGIVAYRLP